ncbi:unnamed protein product [Callosobruchus maculatus]|uniref:Uncharacterized protein n=1 Tax=Callosobruchus maculatus TaxID=64391 RepID=A0A653C0Y7_CALMS|nr:unnamed protein product [Callosobruchus maculatus]
MQSITITPTRGQQNISQLEQIGKRLFLMQTVLYGHLGWIQM